jgi:cardiolipin synthase
MDWTVFWIVVGILVDLVVRVTALIVVPRNRKPTAAMAWLLAIFFIPYIGVFLFLLIGSPKLPKSRREKQERINEIIASGVPGLTAARDSNTWPAWLPGLVAYNESLGAAPMVGGNSARLIADYAASLHEMSEAIGQATKFVHIEFYIVAFDDTTHEFFAAMEAAVARGVAVRVLLDHIASIRTSVHRATFAELDRIGVEWSFMLPVQPFKGNWQRPDLRNHRKLVVVDGEVGFTGSQNLISRDYNSKKKIRRGLMWQELMTRVTGPAVHALDVIFLSDWFIETGEPVRPEEDFIPAATGDLDCQVVPSGPGFVHENNLRLFLGLIHSASSRVIITSPYFVPDEALMYAITSARGRGLDVQLFVSEIGDQGPVFHAQRSYYSDLLEAGVRIWLYPAPFILHSKHLSIDDDIAVIGSSNMDIRSFALDLEVSLLVHGEGFVAQMRQVEQDYRDAGRELTLEEWRREPLRRTFADGLARLTSALQ